jgi:hypothetical protein
MEANTIIPCLLPRKVAPEARRLPRHLLAVVAACVLLLTVAYHDRFCSCRSPGVPASWWNDV